MQQNAEMDPCCASAVKGRLYALMRREVTLMTRNLVVFRAKVMQVAVIALVAATLYLRTHIHPISPNDGQEIAGFLFFSTLVMLFNGIAELSMTVSFCATCTCRSSLQGPCRAVNSKVLLCYF